MAAESLTKGRGVFLLFIISLGVGVIGWGSPASKPELCLNPPNSNPNKCHVYTWNHAPNDNVVEAKTGLFGNDTTYYFPQNITGTVGFTLCVNYVLNPVEDGNFTLTVQFMNSSDTNWWNLAQNGGRTGGSVSLASPGMFCSQQEGTYSGTTIFNTCIQFAPGHCELRIGASTPQTPCSRSNCIVELAQLAVTFYSGAQTIQGSIVCDATTRSLSSFTTMCVRTFSTVGAQGITVGWQATNSTGSGCGLLFNCWRGPATFTCTIPGNGFTCTIVTTYSPAFLGSTPIPILDWSPVSNLQVTVGAPFVYNVLT